MEIRVERKKKNNLFDRLKKLHMVWKILAMVLAVCLLAGGLSLWNRQEPALAAEFQMKKDPESGKYVFNIVEVVPSRNDAVMGLFIGGEEQQTISMEKLEKLVNKESWEWQQEGKNLLYWKDKSGSSGSEPFTVVEDGTARYVVNNEIFKLYMLGNAVYDPAKNIYENFSSAENQASLKEFNEHYIIKYQIVTPSELDRMDLDEIQYLHIGGAAQIDDYPKFYNKISKDNGGTANWDKTFSDDFGWSTTLKLYNRALASPKLSVSFSGYQAIGNGLGQSTNLFKFYQMLYYFDDPSMFNEVFQGGKLTNTQCYISKEDGAFYISDKPGVWNKEVNWYNDKFEMLSIQDVPHGSTLSYRPDNNYIVEKYDNILIFSNNGKSTGYFDKFLSVITVNKILNFTGNGGNPPEEPEEGSIKVLEIQPSDRYWLTDSDNLKQLAIAIGEEGHETDISVTYVTPNILNGMTVDLAAEYDLIVVGSNTELFRSGSSYNGSFPYYHIGMLSDAVTLQTPLNGLLKKDYTTTDKFNTLIKQLHPNAQFSTGSLKLEGNKSSLWNDGIKTQWNNSELHFLKNVELELALQSSGEEPVSRARFNGNDLTRYMQKQLAEFIASDQPVIIADELLSSLEKRYETFRSKEGNKDEKDTLDPKLDARMYLALLGIGDEREFYGSEEKAPGQYLDKYKQDQTWGNVQKATSAFINLQKEWKPEIELSDNSQGKDESGEPTVSIMKKIREGSNLETLVKSNTLSFNYTITLPFGTEAKNCYVNIVIDRNGDGIFDEGGDGKAPDGKKGSQNNATNTILNDQVFTLNFAQIPATEYTLTGQELSGTFTAPEQVKALEEFCEFRAVVHVKNNNGGKYRGVWTGYMRPNLKQKEVKILQVMPYKEEKGKSLKDTQFKDCINALGTDREYLFNWESGFDVTTLSEFEDECMKGEITADSLKQYDLIIMGTSFSSDAADGIIDPKEQKMAEMLKTYTDTLKRPIIFTNEAMSYVNSANYYTPIEQEYYFRDMTLEEGEKLLAETAGQDPKTVFDGNSYRKIRISDEEEYRKIKERNDALVSQKKDEGTVYIEDLYTEDIAAGTYKALMYPIKDSDSLDGRYTEDVDIGWKFLGWGSDTVVLDGTELDPANLADLLKDKGYKVNTYSWWLDIYRQDMVRLGYITPAEWDKVQNDNVKAKAKIGIIFQKTVQFYLREFYSLFQKKIPLSADAEVTEVKSGDQTYYLLDGKYLTERVETTTQEKYSYKWQKAVPGTGDGGSGSSKKTYTLSPVAAGSMALYPDMNSWNGYLTQTMRNSIGMDRFAVTTAKENSDKRDYGSSYRYGEVEEIQGYTDAALLEYAYLPAAGSPWHSVLQTNSQYKDLPLNTKPRTTYIEPLNEGLIGLYPYRVMPENETKLTVNESHAPYYQLDLDRETGKGKIDDVTVWYTLAGSGKPDDASRYFNIARKDAANNYYLYSKGKTYYTGFSLTDTTKDGNNNLVPEQEMKLFVNTVYAALNTGEALKETYYDTVLREDGTISSITLSDKIGAANQYTCYYDEDDAILSIYFRIQRANAPDNDSTPLIIGTKEKTEENALPSVTPIVGYSLLNPADNSTVPADVFPVAKVAEVPGTSGSLGPDVSNVWYQMTFQLPDEMDGKTLVIGPASPAENGIDSFVLNPAGIYAEIRMVKRNLFDLD